MSAFHGLKFGCFFNAMRDHMGTARMEVAPARAIDGAWHVALEDDALASLEKDAGTFA